MQNKSNVLFQVYEHHSALKKVSNVIVITGANLLQT